MLAPFLGHINRIVMMDPVDVHDHAGTTETAFFDPVITHFVELVAARSIPAVPLSFVDVVDGVIVEIEIEIEIIIAKIKI